MSHHVYVSSTHMCREKPVVLRERKTTLKLLNAFNPKEANFDSQRYKSTVLASAGFDDFSTQPSSRKVFPKIPEPVAWTADVYIGLLSAVSLSGILSSFRH